MSFILPSCWSGRFGNRMYQYLYAYQYSKINNIDMVLLSEWEGSKLFKNKPYKLLDKNIADEISSSKNKRNDMDPYIDILIKHYPNINQIVPNSNAPYSYLGSPTAFCSGCFYNEEIFLPMNKKDVLWLFEFSDEVKETESYKYWKSRSGTYDVAHLRRDDVSDPDFNNKYIQWYSTISLDSYTRAFDKFGYDKNAINIISDDHSQKWHEDRKPTELLGWSYPEGSKYKEGIIFDWLDDFLKMYFARTIFRANSSFSWWAAFLSPSAKVYSPVINDIKIYGKDGIFEELDVDFVEGNSPHWFYEPGVFFSKTGKREIIINE
jgi:hypothetical protein